MGGRQGGAGRISGNGGDGNYCTVVPEHVTGAVRQVEAWAVTETIWGDRADSRHSKRF